MNISVDDYTLRIAQATPVQLVVINYELLINHAKAAQKAESKEQFLKLVRKARSFNELLMNTLDLSYEIGRDLMPVYIYVNKLLIKAEVTEKPESLSCVIRIMSKLLESWVILSHSEHQSKPVADNAQQVFAGLTYKNGMLQETVIENLARGYEA